MMLMSKNNQPGKIDLRGLFQAIAVRLKVAGQQGKILHKTKNIRDSGATLEREFREFLRPRIPAPYSITAGYLFEPTTRCTPQIDCIVLDDRDSHEIMRSDDGSGYVPYPAGRIIIEIKNSAENIDNSVKQLAAIRVSVRAMIGEGRRSRGNLTRALEEPLSVLVIADSTGARLSSFKKAFSVNCDLPDYTMLLDKGLIIARRMSADDFFVSDGRDGVTKPFALDNINRRNGAGWAIWTPEGHPGDSGHALLWIYFALIAELNRPDRSEAPIINFTDQIVYDFPMVHKSDLASATTW